MARECMAYILAIDPGVNMGWAVFESDRLRGCGLGGSTLDVTTPGHLAIIEHPMIYPGGKTKDPNAIVKLAVSAGEMSGMLKACGWPKVSWVLPRAWKGTIDPDMCNARIWNRLDAEEQRIVDRAVVSQKIISSKRHNVLDAIGIGLYACSRWTIKPPVGSL